MKLNIQIKQVHADTRGTITTITVGSREFILLETVNGKLRGGDIHQTPQHDKVLIGEIAWLTPNSFQLVKEGEEVVTESGIPHMMKSQGDSLVLEWMEGSFEKTYYLPFRKLVEASR